MTRRRDRLRRTKKQQHHTLTPLEKAVVHTWMSDRLTTTDLNTIIEHTPDVYPADKVRVERERCKLGLVRYADLPQELRDVYDRIPPHVRAGWEAVIRR